MLKNITIFSDRLVYLEKDYGISFKNPNFLPKFLRGIDEEMTVRGYYEEENTIDILTLKIICYKIKSPPLFFALTYDDSIDPEQVYPHLQDLIEATLGYIEKTNSENEIHDKEILEQDCDLIIKKFLMLRPSKICIIGDESVGKTTICELIIGSSSSTENLQAVGVKKFDTELFGIPIVLYDVKLSIDWKSNSKFLTGSDAIILVLDSTNKNARLSKSYIELTQEVVPAAELLIIANKQDIEGALKPEELKDIINNKVFPFVAKLENQELIQKQIAKLLEIKAEGIDYSEENYIIQRND